MRILMRLCGAALLVVMIPLMANAQDAARARGNLLTTDNSEGVLMLNSGRIVSGKLKQISTGYLVASRSGYISVDRDDIRFAANDLGELYLLQKRELKDPSIAEQMKLAEWCCTQKLNAFAAKELLAVLNRDPSNEHARKLLARLDDDQQRAPATPTANRDSSGKKLADDEARSLAGLKGATAERFSSSIQPLLHNKCGNAKCHGPSADHEFRLTRGSPGAGHHRIYAERNLAAVMKYVDLDRPQGSKILKIADGAHAGQTMFSGHQGAEQRKLLTDWVLQAAKDLNPKSANPAPVSVFAGNSDKAPATREAKPESRPISAEPEKTASSKSISDPQALLTDTEKSNFRKVLDAAESDAFDPEEFNRRTTP